MGLIPEEIIAQVLDRCNIVETISSYIPLKRAGRNYKANCPFHNEKTPSFVVNPDKQIFHCFGCAAGGNVITFVMKQERLEFPEALRMLAGKVGIDVPISETQDAQTLSFKELLFKVNEIAAQFFHNYLITSKEPIAVSARDYLKGRGITLDTVMKAKLGLATDHWDRLLNFLKAKNFTLSFMEKAGLIIPQENRDGFYDRFRSRIIFPIFDTKSRCIAFGARAMKEGMAKYINSPETMIYTKGQHLYGLHLAKDAISSKDFVIVVEGYMDFLIPYQAGVDNIVASQGTALTVEQIRLLRRYSKNIVMLFDADSAGEAAMVRSLDLLIEEGMNVKVAALVPGEDPDTYVRKFGIDEFHKRIEEAKSLVDYKLSVLLSRHSHKTVEGKERISSEMLPTIAKFRNAVARFSYIKQLSDVLSVPEEALFLEIQKIPQAPSARAEEMPQKRIIPAQLRAIERDLLKLLLHDGSCLLAIKESVSLSDFQDDCIKNIMAQVFELAEKGKEITVPNLMIAMNDEPVVQFLSELASGSDLLVNNKDKMLKDYIEGIKKNRLKKDMQDLSHQIKSAENTGDQIKLDECRHKYNQLLKQG